MKRKKITRVIDVTVLHCIISNSKGVKAERDIEIPATFGTYRAAEKAIRDKLADGYTLVELEFMTEKKVRCSMYIDAFYSCSSKEELE